MKTVYKIFDKEKKGYTGSYSRACHDQYEFNSESEALNANCHGMYNDTDKYEIHEVEVVETVVKALPPKKEHADQTRKKKEQEAKVEEYLSRSEPLSGFDEINRRMNAVMMVSICESVSKFKKDQQS